MTDEQQRHVKRRYINARAEEARISDFRYAHVIGIQKIQRAPDIEYPDNRNGDRPTRGVNFYQLLRDIRAEFVLSYDPPKQIKGRLADEPETNWVIFRDHARGSFGFTSEPLEKVLADIAKAKADADPAQNRPEST